MQDLYSIVQETLLIEKKTETNREINHIHEFEASILLRL